MPTESPERLVVRTSDLEQDRFTRVRCASFIGSVVMNPEVQLEPIEDPNYTNLLEAAQGAAEGNPEGLANVRSNSHIATVEAIYKAGHITRVKTRFRTDGSVVQHGQAMMNTYKNSLLYTGESPQMSRRVKAETLNGHRIEDLKKTDLLTDYWLFVPSLYPDDMSDDLATKNGFFGDTKTAALQATIAEGDVCVTESAFVAGVTELSGKRHDLEAVRAMYKAFGYNATHMTANDFLENPLLVHKSLMPNGIVDLVRIFDDNAGGTFFGQNVPKRSYIDFAIECQNREARLHDTVDEVTGELINGSANLTTPIEAVQLLYAIVKRKVVKAAAQDKSIDAHVFGEAAFLHIEQARRHMEMGDIQKALQAIDSAALVARVTMCGIGESSITDELNANSSEAKVDKDCDYISKQCPLCHRKNARTHETKHKIECKECKGYVKKAA